MGKPAEKVKKKRGRPRVTKDQIEAMLLWAEKQYYRLRYKSEGKKPAHVHALATLAAEHGKQSSEAMKHQIERALRSLPPQVRAMLPDMAAQMAWPTTTQAIATAAQERAIRRKETKKPKKRR